MEAVGHILSDEEYEEFQRLRDIVLANANDQGVNHTKGGNQRVNGLNQAAVYHPSTLPKVIYDGHNSEEFVSKFRHIAEAYKISKVLYEDYGSNPPQPDDEAFAEWVELDSRAYRVLEKHINSKDMVIAER
jgi:hypothetical protein